MCGIFIEIPALSTEISHRVMQNKCATDGRPTSPHSAPLLSTIVGGGIKKNNSFSCGSCYIINPVELCIWLWATSLDEHLLSGSPSLCFMLFCCYSICYFAQFAK